MPKPEPISTEALDPIVPLQVRMPESVVMKVKISAVLDKVTISEYVRRALNVAMES